MVEPHPDQGLASPRLIDDLSASLAGSNASLKQAFHLVISATCERTKEGMDRLLDKANRSPWPECGTRWSPMSLPSPCRPWCSSPWAPCLPIMLFSILPLLSIGTSMGAEASPAIPFPYLAFLLLAVMPVSGAGSMPGASSPVTPWGFCGTKMGSSGLVSPGSSGLGGSGGRGGIAGRWAN